MDSQLPPCSTVTGAAGSMLTRFEIDALLDSQDARDAGVFVARGLLSFFQDGADVKLTLEPLWNRLP